MPAGYHMTFVRTVTRYGGYKHLARDEGDPFARHYTVCAGTSSWTVLSWERNPDHPLLTIEQIRALGHCAQCARATLPFEAAPPVIYTHDSLVIERNDAEFLCGDHVQAPCTVPDCQRPHSQHCTRPLGHPPDVHVALGINEITSVWAVSGYGRSTDGGDRDPA